MRSKKKNEDVELTPDKELEQKVDAMMDLRAEPPAEADASDAKIGKVEGIAPIDDANPPEIDIFKDTKTAPVLTGKKPSKHKKLEPLHPEELKQELEAEPEEELGAPKLPVEEAAGLEDETDIETDEETTDEAEETFSLEEDEPVVTIADAEEKAAVEAEANEPLSDAETDEVIDDIVKEDSDKLLDLDDEEKPKAEEPQHHKPHKHSDHSFKEKLGNFFRAWWGNKWARSLTILLILCGLAGLAAWPTSRYFVLNTSGVRSSLSLKVTDESTGLPLKNVVVEVGALTARTDESGTAKFAMVRLGSQQLNVERVAFAPIHKTIVVGWGSNPLGEMSLEATGAQYVFDVKDYLSGKPVKAEAVSGDASAFADKKGKIVLTVEDPQTDTLSVKVKADEYRTEEMTFAATSKEVFSLRMVPAQPVVYVSKKSGKYDLYRTDVDGKNKVQLLAGTGRERQSMGVSVSPDGAYATLVSSRGTKRDSNGYLLDTLTLINLKDNKTSTIEEAQSIRAVDWSGSRLIYLVTYAAPSASTGDRQRIISYNAAESARSVLSNSDYFNGIVSAKGYVYYAIANSDPKQPASFNRIKADGTSKQTILNKQVWTIQQSDNIAKLNLETPDGWYDYTLGAASAQKGTPPAETYVSRQYVSDSSGTKYLWVESRDGKGVLLIHEENTSKDNMLVSASGVSMPARWLSGNAVVYRVSNSNETADYVKSTQGGDAKKISDVTPTFGPGASY